MHEPWQESWERPASVEPAGPLLRERVSALVIIVLASAGFLVTVVWPVVTAFR
jgi:hypothetical protein